MATSKEAKVKFTADTSEFTANIGKANSEMGKLRSELKLNATEMKGAGDSVELLTKRQGILAKESEASRSKIEALTAKLEVAKSIYGENSVEANRLATQLNNARTAEARIQQEIAEVNGKLQQQESAARKADTVLGRLEGAARDLASGFNVASKSADDLDVSIGNIAFGNIIADAASSAASALVGLSEQTAENRFAMNKLETSFESSGRSIEQAHEVYQTFLGLTKDSDQAAEAAQDMKNLADAGADINTWYGIAAGAVSAFGDALPVENLIESANETIRTGVITGGLADAINWTSINQKKLNKDMADHPKVMEAYNKAVKDGASQEDAINAALEKCGGEMERQQLLTSALSQQYSDMGASFNEANAGLEEAKVAQDNLVQAQSKLAEQVQPLQTDITNLAANGIGFLSDHLSIIVPLVGGAAVAFGILAVVVNFGSIVQGLAGAFSVLNAVMAANPIGIVVALIAGLVVAFVGLWNTCEPFRNFWIGLWEGIKSSTKGAVNSVGKFITGMKTKISSVFKGIKTTAASVWNGIKNAITNPIGTAQKLVKTAIDKIKGFFSFKVSWPHIPMPHFSVSPSGWKVGDLLKGSIPKLGIEWYAKGGVLTKPTIFGANGGNLMAGGEAGREAIAPISVLQGYVRQAVAEGGGSGNTTIINGISYDDGSAVSAAVEQLVRALRIDGRM